MPAKNTVEQLLAYPKHHEASDEFGDPITVEINVDILALQEQECRASDLKDHACKEDGQVSPESAVEHGQDYADLNSRRKQPEEDH